MAHNEWRSLDNSARAFPATVKKSDTRVFRFTCTLKEEVKPAELQMAVDDAINDYPAFRCVMRRGFFWYYLEQCDLRPIVKKEYKSVCDVLYLTNRKELLFEVTYNRNRIHLEVFHALSDGAGALSFFRQVVYNYLLSVHEKEFEETPYLDDNSSAQQKSSDAFSVYYSKEKRLKKESLSADSVKKAYNIKGAAIENDAMLVLDATMPLARVKELAKSYDAGLTAFIIAVFIKSIGNTMTLEQKKLPLAIGVPVNLRNFFPSETSRNFFGVANVVYNFSEGTGELEEIIASAKKQLEEQLTRENLHTVIQGYAFFEKNFIVRVSPLVLKDLVVRLSRTGMDKKATTNVSNMGQVKLPEEMEKYVSSFHFLVSTLTLQLTMCSFADTLQVGFTSCFKSPEIQKEFFRTLSEMGVDVTVSANHIIEGRDNRNVVL